MKSYRKSVWLILALIVATSAALVFMGGRDRIQARSNPHLPIGPTIADDLVSIRTDLVQDKFLIGSNGQVSLALELTAADLQPVTGKPRPRTDLTIVLDRSGSMGGQKLDDARQAILRLLGWLSPEDRLALVIYDNTVQTLFPLTSLDDFNRRRISSVVESIGPGGSTNLGGGLSAGIDAAIASTDETRQRKVILISDGLANYGIVDPGQLGQMASGAAGRRISISTVGVGNDFNEVLMTLIADHGQGQYHFLENPQAFAQVFEHEFKAARNVAASGLEIRVPLKDGLQVVAAGGYPIRTQGDWAVIQPGDLLSGEKRRIFISLQYPADSERQFRFEGLTVNYQKEGVSRSLTAGGSMPVACIKDPKAVMASIDGAAWAGQVVQDDFGRLKEAVADAVRKGERTQALSAIQEYEVKNGAINSSVGSAEVKKNLETDVQDLRQKVEMTFTGPPAAVAEKQKSNAKVLQYEGYQSRRAKK